MIYSEKNGLRILTADADKMLHRIKDMTSFSPIVYLGVNDSPDNYAEIDAEEAKAIIEQADALPSTDEEQSDAEDNTPI